MNRQTYLNTNIYIVGRYFTHKRRPSSKATDARSGIFHPVSPLGLFLLFWWWVSVAPSTRGLVDWRGFSIELPFDPAAEAELQWTCSRVLPLENHSKTTEQLMWRTLKHIGNHRKSLKIGTTQAKEWTWSLETGTTACKDYWISSLEGQKGGTS